LRHGTFRSPSRIIAALHEPSCGRWRLAGTMDHAFPTTHDLSSVRVHEHGRVRVLDERHSFAELVAHIRHLRAYCDEGSRCQVYRAVEEGGHA